MTKREAARAFRKISKELEHLHSAASNHISRLDNNWVFERIYSFRYIAERIEDGYNTLDYEKGGGPHHSRFTRRTSDHS